MSTNEETINDLEHSLQNLSVNSETNSSINNVSAFSDIDPADLPIPNLNYELADSDSDSEFRGFENMAQPRAQPALALPAVQSSTEQLISAASNYGKVLPKYDGKPNSLESFIAKVNTFYDKYGNTRDETLNQYVFCTICSRLIDEADNLVTCRPDITNWPDLKTALRNKFGDLTDRKILFHQFKNLKLRSGESLSNFIERIRAMQSHLDIKIQMDDNVTNEQKQVHREINEQTSIEVLYNNSPQILQTILDIRDHDNFAAATATALNFITKHPVERTPKLPNTNSVPQNITNRHNPSRQYSQINKFAQQNQLPWQSNQNNYPIRNNQPFRNSQSYHQSPRPIQRDFPNNFYQPQNKPNFPQNQARQPQVRAPSNVQKYQGTNFRRWRQPQPHLNNNEVNFSHNIEQSEQPFEQDAFSSNFSPNCTNYDIDEYPSESFHDQTQFPVDEEQDTYYSPEELNESIQNFRLLASEK